MEQKRIKSIIDQPNFSKTPADVLKFIIRELMTENNELRTENEESMTKNKILADYIDALDVKFCISCCRGRPTDTCRVIMPHNGLPKHSITICGECMADHYTIFCRCGNFHNVCYSTSSVSKLYKANDGLTYCADCLTSDAMIVYVINAPENKRNSKTLAYDNYRQM